ncbi:hypothetical protein RSAG8_12315, partial [Rhizoctonia solani AG-8 WAC10335]
MNYAIPGHLLSNGDQSMAIVYQPAHMIVSPALRISNSVTFDNLDMASTPHVALPVFALSTCPTPTPRKASPSTEADVSMAAEGAYKVHLGVWLWNSVKFFRSAVPEACSPSRRKWQLRSDFWG